MVIRYVSMTRRKDYAPQFVNSKNTDSFEGATGSAEGVGGGTVTRDQLEDTATCMLLQCTENGVYKTEK